MFTLFEVLFNQADEIYAYSLAKFGPEFLVVSY